MAMASSSHIEETVEDHEEDEGPIPVSKLEVKFLIIFLLISILLC